VNKCYNESVFVSGCEHTLFTCDLLPYLQFVVYIMPVLVWECKSDFKYVCYKITCVRIMQKNLLLSENWVIF